MLCCIVITDHDKTQDVTGAEAGRLKRGAREVKKGDKAKETLSLEEEAAARPPSPPKSPRSPLESPPSSLPDETGRNRRNSLDFLEEQLCKAEVILDREATPSPRHRSPRHPEKSNQGEPKLTEFSFAFSSCFFGRV